MITSSVVAEDGSCWTAEWRIPFDSICIDPEKSRGCCFNIGVNKTGARDDSSPASKKAIGTWAVWIGTGGANWEVWNAGRLFLGK